MTKPVLAAQLYTVREYTRTAEDFAASMKKIRQIGYQAVQVSAIGPIPHQEVKAIVEDLGLTICNTHIPYDRLWNDLDSVIEQHHLWNCRHVAIGSLPAAYREEGEDGYRRFAQEASQVGEKLHAAGLTFSYHNHGFEFERFGKRTALDIIYEESDPRYLQAEIDTYWVQHGGGDPAAWIRRMKGRMPVVHLKDMVIVDRQQVMAEVGEGNLNWPAILDACREAGVEWYAVEQDICRRDPFESLRISYENLRAMGLA
ncbi:sugar phosphate isomerase/epimerase [Litorilinea aerophila]|uniref:Sugar phosphate isomerase/epimerase n=1 Tax=Litorilinea aerophila TaxID=1204385 RepID=A0A540VIA2_9CHLR|nr:sugar phosphate isomerase/epimerase [Litorilinea aerophila]MCC9076566.1 sugar phosphate isomerase/epimerase [Litorilinea aerophila]OUC05255.1 xylose isomerase [Litorilinea aerophila]